MKQYVIRVKNINNDNASVMAKKGQCRKLKHAEYTVFPNQIALSI